MELNCSHDNSSLCVMRFMPLETSVKYANSLCYAFFSISVMKFISHTMFTNIAQDNINFPLVLSFPTLCEWHLLHYQKCHVVYIQYLGFYFILFFVIPNSVASHLSVVPYRLFIMNKLSYHLCLTWQRCFTAKH